MRRVEDFISGYGGDQKYIMNFFHSLLTEEFNLTPKLQYNLPFYYRKLVSSIGFKNLKEISENLIKEVLHEAIILDETVPYVFKKM